MQETKTFQISGHFLEKKKKKKFSTTVGAQNENTAKEKVLAIFGSKQKIKRRHIFIEEIKEEN
ncbi:MAG: 50S ribosomal protein L18a [Candidatus Diapherotrites archaeon]|nr:50S ribosomal protein L18a [Candidatus Diapherotrites archaeon]